jgi:hypothetical protein
VPGNATLISGKPAGLANFYSTKQTAKLVGEPVWTLNNALQFGKLDPPAKDHFGNYLWSKDDIARLKQYLSRAGRRVRKAVAS